MKSYVIYLPKSKLSTDAALNVIEVAKEVGEVDVELWEGVDKFNSEDLLDEYDYDPDINKFISFSDFESALGCFFSHHSLWEESVRTNERIMILEHDAIFFKKFIDHTFEGVVNIGSPLWGSRDWSETTDGLHERKCNNEHDLFNTPNKSVCQCDTPYLYGAHAYIVTPKVSEMLLEKAKIQIFPADAFIESHKDADIRIPVADLLPHCVEQKSTFSLIQKAGKIHWWWDIRDTYLHGNGAWKDYGNE
jgi:GR25 family glycosyltransferase involved in LPS biosynthesis|tara:strand:- start:484 stop:1227 length:744 start_codon:yes stop_codon:yes gene_type:complete